MDIALNDDISIDLQKLIDTRLLVQANSGGGKSWLLRRILEQSHGKVQQIIIDVEGEFSTLREKYDYILAGKEGDTAAEPQSASLLARRLLELNVSAIIDLYELSHQDRKRFVKLFLSSMVNAPKSLWHPCLVVIDECHIFAPQVGQSEALESVIDLATRGRKRGYSAILATQRISKLHKDAAAEMNNVLIGRTGLDIDRKRASEELGFTSKDQNLSLRNLAPGEFFAFGPALSQEVTRIQVGSVQTSHPKAGDHIMTTVTPPTDKIKAILSKLTDLPQEAKKEMQTLDTLRAENTTLKRKVTMLERQSSIPEVRVETKTVMSPDPRHEKALRDILQIAKSSLDEHGSPLTVPTRDGVTMNNELKKPIGDSIIENRVAVDQPRPITGGAMRMLEVLANRYPMTFTKSQLALMAKMSPRSGSYGTYLSRLRSAGYLVEDNGQISISEGGLEFVGVTPTEPQSQEEVLAMWSNNLNGGARRMFDYLVQEYPRSFSKQELGEAIEMSATSGSFSTYLSRIKSNGLVDVAGGSIKASSNLFVE